MVSLSDYQSSKFLLIGFPTNTKIDIFMSFYKFMFRCACFLLVLKKLLLQLKNMKHNHSSTSESLEYTKPRTEKRHVPSFSMRMDVNRD